MNLWYFFKVVAYQAKLTRKIDPLKTFVISTVAIYLKLFSTTCACFYKSRMSKSKVLQITHNFTLENLQVWESQGQAGLGLHVSGTVWIRIRAKAYVYFIILIRGSNMVYINQFKQVFYQLRITRDPIRFFAKWGSELCIEQRNPF